MGPPDADPKELLYAESHEWVRVTEEADQKIVTVGISSFAVEQLTDLVFMDLNEVGTQLNVQDEFGEVESVKAVSPLYSPVAGEIIDVNAQVPDNLELLGEDPYGAGWLIKIMVSDESGLAALLDHEAYQKQCAEAS